MAVAPMGPAGGVAGGLGPAEQPRSAMGAFGRLVDHLLGAANRQQVSADTAVQNLVTGQTDNLHGVMLAVAQADLALRMVVEVRNRLTEAFQEVMRMQM